MAGTLEGVRIIDLTRYAPGPYCTMILADLGASVIKIESLEKPPIRVQEFPSPGSPYDPLNRNKKSIALNLKTEKGREIFYRLVSDSHVVLESFRPGVVKRLKIDYETIKKINDKIIYCSITGYGQDGPYKDLPGHDINYISQGGVIGILSKPVIPGNLIGDMAGGGLMATIGILGALFYRQRTGKGQFVDISITDSVVSLMSLYLAKYFEKGISLKPHEMSSTGGTPFYNLYKTKDNKWISIACDEPWFFENLCTILQCEEFLIYREEKDKWPEIKKRFEEKFLTRTRDEWFEVLSKNHIPVGKVYSLDELPMDMHLNHREMFIEMESGICKEKIRLPGIPIKFSETPGTIRSLSPRLGEHTEEILTEIGYSKNEIRLLHDQGVVFADTLNIESNEGKQGGRKNGV